MSTFNLEIGGGVKSTGPAPADFYYRPEGSNGYASVAAACAAVPVAVRIGRTVLVDGVEYAWGTDTSDAGLTIKSSGGTANAIPLAGTEEDKPVTGIVVVNGGKIRVYDGANDQTIDIEAADGLRFRVRDAATGTVLSDFSFSGNLFQVPRLQLNDGFAPGELNFDPVTGLGVNGQPVFTPIEENKIGTHPAFATQDALNDYLLAAVQGMTYTPPPAAPTGLIADEDERVATFTVAPGKSLSDYEQELILQ